MLRKFQSYIYRFYQIYGLTLLVSLHFKKTVFVYVFDCDSQKVDFLDVHYAEIKMYQ